MKAKKLRHGAWIIWHAAIWVIWKARNDRFFNIKVLEVEEMIDKTMVVSWYWSLSRLKIASCLFYEWCLSARDCFAR